AALIASALLFKVWLGLGIDESGYYLWLSSMAFDGDLDQSNDMIESGLDPEFISNNFINITPLGVAPNQFSVGPAVIWGTVMGPWILIERAIRTAVDATPLDRLAWHLRLILSLMTLTIGCHAMLMLYHVLRRFHSPGICLASTCVAVLGSPALSYMMALPAMSHTYALWATTMMWWLALRLWDRGPRSPGMEDWAMGLAVGLIAIIRWPAVVWAAVPAAIYLSQMIRPGNRLGALGGAAIASVAAMLVFAIQMAAWHGVFGEWLTIPQGRGFLVHEEASLPLIEVLFSPWNGLFHCHPWLLLALIALPLWMWRAPIPALGALAALGATWVINASATDWWAGTAFGGRRWIHTMPVFALGWASLLQLLSRGGVRRWVGGSVSLGVIVINGLLALLWGRAVIRESWWSHWPLAGDVFQEMLHHPLEWIDSDIWSLALGRPGNLWLSLTLLILIGGGLAGLGWMARGGRVPWPHGRLARAATWAVTVFMALMLTVTLWASTRAPHVDQHLALREIMRRSWSPEVRWELIQRDLEIDRTCPVHLAVVGDIALRCGDQALGHELLHRLEEQHPRFALLRILQVSEDIGERHSAILRLLSEGRWQDPLTEANLLQAPAFGEGDALLTHVASPAAPRGFFLAALAQQAREDGLFDLERDRMRAIRARAPQDVPPTLRLAELADLAGETAEAERLRALARLWCETRLRIFERLAESSPTGVGRHLTSEVVQWGTAYLSTLDHVTEFDEAKRTVARVDRLIQRRPLRSELCDHLFQMRWAAARRVADQPEGQRLIEALEAHLRAHMDEIEGHLALIEVWGLRGNWREACLVIWDASHRFPDEVDWLEQARKAAAGLTAEQTLACDPSCLPEDVRITAATGLLLHLIDIAPTEVTEALQTRWLPPQGESDETGQRWLAVLRALRLHAWVRAREVERSEERIALLSIIERCAEVLPGDVDSALALIEIRGLVGDWQGSCLALVEGQRLNPSGSDWLTAAAGIAVGVAHDEIESAATDGIEALPEETKTMALAGLAHRAGALRDFPLALSLWRRVRERGLESARLDEIIASLERPTR
ncbi:hypothetical protein JXA47_15305, partial [Candidatus Sumerlaeota bacterium]|nr:hypothetical protein [Candidatus Sumerlaeota bacterium]